MQRSSRRFRRNKRKHLDGTFVKGNEKSLPHFDERGLHESGKFRTPNAVAGTFAVVHAAGECKAMSRVHENVPPFSETPFFIVYASK